ncbi:MAG: hypothetical protein ACRDY0_06735 [Acidimicrobiales bacterium]
MATRSRPARSRPAGPGRAGRAQAAKAGPAQAAKARPAEAGPAPEVRSPAALLAAGLVVGLYAMAPGFYLDGLKVRRGAEIVDHVVPGVVVLAMVCVAIFWGQRSLPVMIGTGMVVLLAGLWMVATHLGLFRQGLRNQAPWGAVAYHCSTAAAVFVLGAVWVWRYREALAD